MSGQLQVALTKIVSGGQTGVDRGALDAALAAGFPCGGWCPGDRRAEDGKVPDFYPLTPYSLAETNWMAWQFHAPDRHAGFVQAFRRSQSEQATTVLRLHGLVPKAQYVITDVDLGMPGKMSGKDLMQLGLPLEIKARPGAAVITYEEGVRSDR